MQSVDRHRKMVGKDDAQDKLIKYMYEPKAGRVITSFLIKPWLSEACKTILDMRSSRLLIPLFIKANNIDMSLYEAANVDGASRFQKLRYITLPGLMPTVVTMFIIRLGTVFDVSLDQILMMKNAFVADVAEVFDTYAYTQGIMQGNLSTGVTVGIFKGVVCMILVVGTNKFIKHLGYEGIY